MHNSMKLLVFRRWLQRTTTDFQLAVIRDQMVRSTSVDALDLYSPLHQAVLRKVVYGSVSRLHRVRLMLTR